MAVSQIFTYTEVCNRFCQFEWLITVDRHFLLLDGTAINDIIKEIELVVTHLNISTLTFSQALKILWRGWYLYMNT